jgi:hypothetical protein
MSLEGMSAEDIAALAGLAKSLSDNPETRLPFQALIKKAHPTTSTPELDAAVAMRDLNAKLAQQSQEFDSFKAQTEAEKLEMRKWAEAVGAGHCSYDDIPNIRAFMTENGLADPVIGAKLWKQEGQIAQPTHVQSNVYEMPADLVSKWKQGGVSNLNRTALGEAHSMMDDIRAGKIKVV